MKVISIVGLSGSGKTTTATRIIKELVSRGYSVGSVKEIHYEAFALDTEGKNTYLHKQNGANPTTALAMHETDIMYTKKLDIRTLLTHYNNDFVILEGVRGLCVPYISTAKGLQDLIIQPHTFAITGVISNSETSIDGYSIVNVLDDEQLRKLVDEIIMITPDLLPENTAECCSLCGADCVRTLDKMIQMKDNTLCKLSKEKVKLFIDGKELPLVDFVKDIIKGITLGIVSNLKGYQKNKKIEIIIEE